jgi:hypothetical protein
MAGIADRNYIIRADHFPAKIVFIRKMAGFPVNLPGAFDYTVRTRILRMHALALTVRAFENEVSNLSSFSCR